MTVAQFYNKRKEFIFFIITIFLIKYTNAQSQDILNQKLIWSKLSSKVYSLTNNEKIVALDLIDNTIQPFIEISKLLTNKISSIEYFDFSTDEKNVLLFCNAKRKWRYKTKGDFFVFNVLNKKVFQIGKALQAELMFAKFSPDGNMVAYVANNNIYVEDLQTNAITKLTTTGSDKICNGTFDWSYEEEFSCRDGFRWSYDSKHIAFWFLDASALPYFTMINNTDSVYPSLITFPYPKVAYAVPKAKLGIVDLTGKKFSWANFSTQNDSFYLPRMDWHPSQKKIIFQYLNRQQNKSKLYTYNLNYKKSDLLYTEKDTAWIDTKSNWKHDDMKGWEWIDTSSNFLWMSEKDGYRHIWIVNERGEDTLLTNENFDVIDLLHIDKATQCVYFLASPNNSTQRFLYKKSLINFSEKAQLLTPEVYKGKNTYHISPDGKYALHSFTNYYTPEIHSIINLKTHKIIFEEKKISQHLDSCSKTDLVKKINFIQIPYPNKNTFLDAWVIYPDSFKATKKYPVLFYVYGEPAAQIVVDAYRAQKNLYTGNKEFIYVGVDNRGAPQPKGRKFRKDIYGKIGIVNVEDQVFATKEILKLPYIDSSKVGVWGWSGGGSLTLNLILQYPDLYKTAISIAPVTDLKLYDNIYEERYMNVLDSNAVNYIKGSAITYAKNLKGNLLLIHGTGDDNVHFQNAEVLINEFIKYNKKFDLMIYPNRSHGIYEGENTSNHLKKIFSEYLNDHLFNSQ